MKSELVRQNIDLPFWTLDMAALHFGVKRATIEKYAREGLPTYTIAKARMVKPAEVITERLRRKRAAEATRLKRTSQQP